MSSRPDPRRAHALVIGTASYADPRYADLPSAEASAQRITDLISDGVIWDGMPAGNIKQLAGSVTTREAAAAIQAKAAIADASALLIYVCGHGQRWAEDHVPDKGLHFAFSDSDRTWPFTHLPFLMVRRMLAGRARAAATLLIIDCCYANGAFLAGDGPAEPLTVPGICTMVATRWPVRAPASWPGTDYTAFSGALIEVIERGIPGPEPYLTPDTAFREMRRLLTAGGKPEPDSRGNGTQVVLCANRAYQAVSGQPPSGGTPDGPPPPETDLASYAGAVAVADAAGRGEEASRLVAAFCQRRAVADTVQLAGILRSADLGQHADHGITHAWTCRSGPELAELVHLLHRQADLDYARLLQVLAQRPASVLAELRAELDCQFCGDCRAANGEIGAQVLAAWPRSELDQLLRALRRNHPDPPREQQ
jgi:hypothetical protein